MESLTTDAAGCQLEQPAPIGTRGECEREASGALRDKRA